MESLGAGGWWWWRGGDRERERDRERGKKKPTLFSFSMCGIVRQCVCECVLLYKLPRSLWGKQGVRHRK